MFLTIRPTKTSKRIKEFSKPISFWNFYPKFQWHVLLSLLCVFSWRFYVPPLQPSINAMQYYPSQSIKEYSVTWNFANIWISFLCLLTICKYVFWLWKLWLCWQKPVHQEGQLLRGGDRWNQQQHELRVRDGNCECRERLQMRTKLHLQPLHLQKLIMEDIKDLLLIIDRK